MISLIIPTYNRPQFIGRLLRYYRELNFAYTIVVADASSTPACEANQNTVAALHDALSIRYELYHPDINPALKIVQALDMVDSEYAVLCADDDFLVPESIELCLKFLQDHAGYSAAQGFRLLFTVARSSQSAGGWTFRIGDYQSAATLSQERATDRLYQHLYDYRPTFYAVCRREQLLDNMQKAVERTQDIRFGELLPSCLTVIQGKVKRLDIPYDIRESHSGQTAQNSVTWGELLVSDDFSDRYRAFRECLVQELVSTAGKPKHLAREVVNRAALAYFGWVYSRYHPGSCESQPAVPVLASDELSIIAHYVLQHAESIYHA